MSVQRRIKREVKRRRKLQKAAQRTTPSRWTRMYLWCYGKLPRPVRRFWARFMLTWKRYFQNPVAPPELIGKEDKHVHRAVVIELGFRLHGDGSVQYINRWGNDVNVANQDVIDMVHHEYNCLVAEARRQHAFD